MPWMVSWAVFVDGVDTTANMRPFLIDIEVTDKDGTASDTCSLTFDDTDGMALLPKDGAKLRVLLQGAQVFSGTVDSVRSSGSRGGGRLLKVSAKGMDSRGKAKEPQSFHKDDAELGDFLDQASRHAGLGGLVIDEDLAGIKRDYWSADGESFVHLGQRIARELNATFKIRAGKSGDVAVLMPRGKEAGMPSVQGVVGRNVISWDIAPFTGRRTFTKAKVSYFDRDEAKFKSEEIEFELDRELPDSVNVIRSPAKDAEQAKGIGKARKSEAEREGGEGSVEIDIAPEAQAEAAFHLTGARPGVDATYRIVSVRHKASRSGGSTTSLELKQPQGGAGKDSRKAEGSNATGGTGSGSSPEPSPGKSSSAGAPGTAAGAGVPARRYGSTDMN